MDGVPSGESRAKPVACRGKQPVVRHHIRPKVWTTTGEVRLRESRKSMDAHDAQTRQFVQVGVARAADDDRRERPILLVRRASGRPVPGISVRGDRTRDQADLTSIELESPIEKCLQGGTPIWSVKRVRDPDLVARDTS